MNTKEEKPMPENTCAHTFVNNAYGPRGGVTVTCAQCGKDVTKPHHRTMAELYRPKPQRKATK